MKSPGPGWPWLPEEKTTTKNGGYMKCESHWALDCIEEIVNREAEVPGCMLFYERQEKN